jgi:hypothetical protein
MLAHGLVLFLAFFAQAESTGPLIDLSAATVVTDRGTGVLDKAATMLQEEIEERTGVRLDRRTGRPQDGATAVVLATADRLPAGVEVPPLGDWRKPDGYALFVREAGGTAQVYVVGHDPRGALFGAGKLLRSLTLEPGRVAVPGKLRTASAPAYPVRGHQLGYRPTNNTYDRWDLKEYEQYIRDLIVFGTNAIELTASVEQTGERSRHMELPAWEMNARLTSLFASYGLDVWFWLPIRGDVSKPAEAEKELGLQRALFQKTPHLDAVFVPGGDPGDTPPDVLLPFLERMAAGLQAVHPKATLWLSNQGFDDAQNDYLFEYLQENRPKWLAGLVFGPWTHMTLGEMRKRAPGQYPIRRYPDICHCVRCEFPVPHWDRAFAHTLGREPFNPRPEGYTAIHNTQAKFSNGFITYSDGVNDDVNKILFTALGWDVNTDTRAILEEYGEYFVGPGYGDAVADGLYMLEKNWKGPLDLNEGVEETLRHWQALEAAAKPETLANWRFQQCLLRAYYDAYTRRRLLQAMQQESDAHALLRTAPTAGVKPAVEGALKALVPAEDPRIDALRARIEELGAQLYESIGMQLDVERYGGLNPERGCVLDFLDTPLNNRSWLESELKLVLQERDGAKQLERIERILNWEDPGPGGYYDDLGNAEKEPHLVQSPVWSDDPGFIESPQDEFMKGEPGWRLSWMDQAQTLYHTPLRMKYEGLRTDAAYRLRVIYTGRFRARMTLKADDTHEIHGPLAGPSPVAPLEFDIPIDATRDGILELRWDAVEGRGPQVAEAWLVVKE